MNYLRRASGVTRQDRMKNKEIYEKSGMSERASSVDYGVVDRVKRNTVH